MSDLTPIAKHRFCKIFLLLSGLLLGLPPFYIWTRTPPSSSTRLPAILPSKTHYDLYVANWGYHTSIIVQQPQGWKLGPANAPDATFVEYSWGDLNFYMNADFSPLALFTTVFLPTPSVLHLRNWSKAPTLKNGMRHLYYRQINAQQLRTLVNSLETSFKTSRAVVLPLVPRFRGRFYPGREYYIFWSACNAWTIRHLAKAGLAKGDLPVAIADQVAPQLRDFKALQSP